jgi:hypothetical protein
MKPFCAVALAPAATTDPTFPGEPETLYIQSGRLKRLRRNGPNPKPTAAGKPQDRAVHPRVLRLRSGPQQVAKDRRQFAPGEDARRIDDPLGSLHSLAFGRSAGPTSSDWPCVDYDRSRRRDAQSPYQFLRNGWAFDGSTCLIEDAAYGPIGSRPSIVM